MFTFTFTTGSRAVIPGYKYDGNYIYLFIIFFIYLYILLLGITTMYSDIRL